MSNFHRFPHWIYETGEGFGAYVPTPEIATAVNTALAAKQPLLVTGEPGVGKTDLARAVWWHLDDPKGTRWNYEFFPVRSDSRGRDLLYHFDHLQRLHDVQARPGEDHPEESYVRYHALGRAMRSERPTVLLIDEIDKAPRDFPNDLLHELDKRTFKVDEVTDLEEIRARAEILVVVTSNDERDLPEAFLRRCVYARLAFPDRDGLEAILRRRLGLPPRAPKAGVEKVPLIPRPPDPETPEAATQHNPQDAATQHGARAAAAQQERLAAAALDVFLELREKARGAEDWRKIPSIGELLRWCSVLQCSMEDPDGVSIRRLEHLFLGALVKTRQDTDAVLQYLRARSEVAHS